jgi:C4-dicarboxylate transporter, DctM subunit
VATAATMTQVALPEMRRAGYEPGFSSGLIAAGGTLGIMIPPSVILVLYGIMTETDISKLFAAGVLPGVMAIALYAAVVSIKARLHPASLPRGAHHGWPERWASLRELWAVMLLFVFVLGGIYGGLFTVQEAAGVGAVGTLVIGLVRRRLRRPQIKAALVESLRVSSAIMMIVVGAYLFGYFLTITQFTQKAVDLLVHLPVGAYGVLALVMLGYLILGAIMDELAMILLTVPIVFPVMVQLGFDPVFVINSIARDVPLMRIYRGTMPFIAVDLLRLVVLCAFPAISLWLPGFVQ